MRLQRGLTFAQQIALAYMRRGLALVLIGTAAAAFVMLIIGLLFMGIFLELGVNFIEFVQMVVKSASGVALGLSALLAITLIWNVLGAAIAQTFDKGEATLHDLYRGMSGRLIVYNAIGLPLFLIAMIILGGFNLFGVMCMGTMTIVLGIIAGDMARTAWADVLERRHIEQQHHLQEAKIREYKEAFKRDDKAHSFQQLIIDESDLTDKTPLPDEEDKQAFSGH